MDTKQKTRKQNKMMMMMIMVQNEKNHISKLDDRKRKILCEKNVRTTTTTKNLDQQDVTAKK